MVRGIDTFKEFFKGFEDNYVIIGGTACEIHEELYAQTPRATKDIDIILIVEALSHEFVARFAARDDLHQQEEHMAAVECRDGQDVHDGEDDGE